VQGTADLGEEEIELMAGAIICRFNDAIARDTSPTGIAQALRRIRTGLEPVDAVVDLYVRATLERSDSEPVPFVDPRVMGV
jgi:hypothetical protein